MAAAVTGQGQAAWAGQSRSRKKRLALPILISAEHRYHDPSRRRPVG